MNVLVLIFDLYICWKISPTKSVSSLSISFYYKYITSSFICQVTGDGEDKYLIATSEQPLCAYHLGDRIYPAELPIKWVIFIFCFFIF
jgi:seryl-tRNA synthetase